MSRYLTYTVVALFCLSDVVYSLYDYNKDDEIRNIKTELAELRELMRMAFGRIGEYTVKLQCHRVIVLASSSAMAERPRDDACFGLD